jgi:hypothetical protein
MASIDPRSLFRKVRVELDRVRAPELSPSSGLCDPTPATRVQPVTRPVPPHTRRTGRHWSRTRP